MELLGNTQSADGIWIRTRVIRCNTLLYTCVSVIFVNNASTTFSAFVGYGFLRWSFNHFFSGCVVSLVAFFRRTPSIEYGWNPGIPCSNSIPWNGPPPIGPCASCNCLCCICSLVFIIVSVHLIIILSSEYYPAILRRQKVR